MRQTAQVKQVLSDGMVEVAVVRQGACSHDCAQCGGCMTAQLPTVTAPAENAVGAEAGDVVVVETANGRFLPIIALTYLTPMAFLIAGYLVAQYVGLTSGWCLLVAGGAFAVSILLVLCLDRFIKRHETLQFKIIGWKQT